MSKSIAVALMAGLAASLNDPAVHAVMRRSPGFVPAPASRSRPDRRTTVAAMKRAAKKRRNVRRNASKRRGAA